ncbi:hypothetical protein ABFU56_08875 [Xanthomonas campestris pv. campestris]|uniref:AbiTii domain-containing protein n=1 Tax=Xanthomonas campestris TaxID=339 RepID=UPI0005E0085A|nr:hypothetical protein [Xanthomonas campestris]MDM7729327.1 hypothetical protein [Xanthomonas campestris pv. campestris]CEM57818.1 hypothetical protein XCCB1459_1698 [Xanthomonas campestris pv. campestris]
MASLVREIQSDAIRRDVSLSELLRKALVVSKKLEVADSGWIEAELNGYVNTAFDDLPAYRQVHGDLKVWNPMRGAMPLSMPGDWADKLSAVPLNESAAELEGMISNVKDGSMRSFFPAAIRDGLMSKMSIPLEPYVVFSSTRIVGALDIIRNKVLTWAIELEAAGVLGDGLSFSREEIQAAQSVSYTTVNNIGTMNNSQLQQHSSGIQSMSLSEGALEEVMQQLQKIVDVADQSAGGPARQALADAQTLMAQLQSPTPKTSVVRESMDSLRKVGEGAIGGALGNALSSAFPVLLKLLATAGFN